MTINLQPVVVIACKVFQDLLEHFLPPDVVDHVTFLDYGLHEFPKELTKTVQEQIAGVVEPSRILLSYGLCGNGLDGIQAGRHTLFIPRALEVAEYCKRWGMKYEEVLGSDTYIHDLVKAISTQFESDDQFLVIPPGGSIEQSQFLRMGI